MNRYAALLLLFLLAACQPAPEPTPAVTTTPTDEPTHEPTLPPAVTVPPVPATLTAVPTSTPQPYPVGTREGMIPPDGIGPEPSFVWGGSEGIIFPIVWYTSPPGPPDKKGLAWHTTVCGDATELGVSWYFNWETRRNSCPADMQPAAFYPIWRPNTAEIWPVRIASDYDGIALWLNEPDRPDQDNLTPVQSAHLYRQFQTSICPRCKVIALNLSKANPGYLVEWREAYRATYGEYPVVFAWGMHAYGYEAQIIHQVQSFHDMLVSIGEDDKQVWLTEWGGCWQGEQPYARQLTPAEMERVIAQFEAWPWLEAYAFFGVRWYKPGNTPPEGLHCESLFTPDGITELGEAYAAPPPSGYPGPGEEHP